MLAMVIGIAAVGVPTIPANIGAAGLIANEGGVWPVPVRLAITVGPPALAVRVPCFTPRAPGLKTTSMVQLAPEARAMVVAHLLPVAEALKSAPVTLTLSALRATPPVFATVKVNTSLITPTATAP